MSYYYELDFPAPAGNHKSNRHISTVLDYLVNEENLIFYRKNQIFFNPDSKTLANQIEQHNIKGSSSSKVLLTVCCVIPKEAYPMCTDKHSGTNMLYYMYYAQICFS